MGAKRTKVPEDVRLKYADDIISKRKSASEVAFTMNVSLATVYSWVNARKEQIKNDSAAAADYVLGSDAPVEPVEPENEAQPTPDPLADLYTQSERDEWTEPPAEPPHPEQAPDDTMVSSPQAEKPRWRPPDSNVTVFGPFEPVPAPPMPPKTLEAAISKAGEELHKAYRRQMDCLLSARNTALDFIEYAKKIVDAIDAILE